MKNTQQTVFKKNFRLWWLFPITGFLALIWYLVRVVPKPSRASYPCQRAAAPLAGGFVLWLSGLIGSTFAFRKIRHFFRQARIGWAIIFIAILLAAGIIAIIHIPQESTAAVTAANEPIGIAKGIQPGRVTWAYDPNATDWDGFTSPEHWYESDHTNLTIVEKMISQVIRGTAGKSTNAAAWTEIFKYHNNERGKGEVGYQSGEKIFIKINLVTCNARFNYVNPSTYEKDQAYLNRIDVSPQVILALLRQLVNTVGVAQNDITVGDPTALMPNHYWNFLHSEFPNVKYLDNYGGSGRTRAEFSTIPFYWSTANANGKLQDYLPTVVTEAEYLINLAVLKGHSSGVSLCAKNHYGTLIRNPDGYLRNSGIVNYYDTHTSLPNAAWSPGLGHYRAHVDLMGHPAIGGKTILYILDGLYSGYYWDAQPVKWKSSPFGSGNTGDWPSSILASQDPVAIDSVGYDFLLAEWPDVVNYGGAQSLQGGAEDYLHEAAQADNPPSGTFYDPDKDGSALESLGVHEHWNNASDKLYSRNLGTGSNNGNGIELFRISNPGNLPGLMTLNRTQLNFAYIMGGSLPGPQTFTITHSGTGVSSWITGEDTSWFSNSPTSGTNTAKITVSVDPSGLAAGTYNGTIHITDLNSTNSSLTLTVNLKIFTPGTDLEPFGNFATPEDGSIVSSSIPVTGWVLDDVGIESVKIYRQDGTNLVFIGDALLVEGARPVQPAVAHLDRHLRQRADR
ncbi:MAG: DUF362 domain-containing protein, partial [Acidobacteria bacterium]|nr:DUF362 domain-containing protein [Acidobacteriota bacterium]